MVTAQMAYWNYTDRTMVFQNAGHHGGFQIVSGGSLVRKLYADQPVLGVFDTVEFHSVTYPISNEDLFLFFTDGISELRRIDGETGRFSQLSVDGVEKIAIAHAALPLDELIRTIWGEALQFARMKFIDDMLLIGVEVGGMHV